MKYLVLKEQILNEINMSPNSLRRAAATIGARAGMEFEMIVPNVGEDEVEPEFEPDYDQDQRTRSFGDIRDFFHDGDYNGRRAVDDLIEEISNEYEEWMQEITAAAWARDGAEFMQDYISLNDLFDRDEAMAEARDQVMDANPDLPQESEEFTQLLSARLDEMEREFAQSEFENEGRIYNDAFEAFTEDQRDEFDERSFLDDKYPYMTDIQNNFDISWPHYYDINDGQSGEINIEDTADSFARSIGREVKASGSYHSRGVSRPSATSLHYVVEPDGSLEGDNPGDGGLEFVSPALPIDELLSDLKKVKAWADKTGCYTNDSTGLHINISVPNWTGDLAKLDFVKLAILMGDEYILEQFGRTGNTYAKSAMKIVRDHVKQRPEDAEKLLSTMKEHLNTSAAKLIHSGSTSKYTSINTKTGYIEFRSPGGDWLNANFDKIESTLLRFVVAMDAAVDETKYKEEYAKKLYKVLAPGSDEPSTLQLFVNYSAGELDKDALIRQVRQQQLARDVNKGKAPAGKKYWWNVSRPGYFASVEVVAASREEAIEKGKVEYPDWRNSTNMTAKPLRPYQEPETTGAAGPTLNGRPSNPDGNWIIVDRRAPTTPVYRFMASGDSDALLVLRQWIAANRESGVEWNFAPDANQRMGQPRAQSAAQPGAGNWGIWIGASQRFARQPNTIVADNVLRRFPTQAAAMAFLERTREENPQMRTDVEVREIPADYTPMGVPVAGAQAVNRNTLTPTGPGPWEVFRISDGSSVAELGQTSRMAAEVEARRVIDQRGEAPELYSVRTRQAQQTASEPVPGSTLDLQRQRAAAAAQQTLTRPGQGQQRFTGEWKIVDANDRELHRFGGVGNVQSDANRIAMDWLRRNPRHMQSGVQVLPVME